MGRLRYGRYETLGLIASGGMASVHLGRAQGPAGFERLVAIKVMHPHIAGDPEFSSMFLDEARLAAQIRHPNVVPTLDVSEDGRIIVMEYVEGAALSAILRQMQKQGERVPLSCALRIALDVLEGLHAAHELRARDGSSLHLVHRDISPHNVLVGVDGISRITDFGIAFAASRLTSTRGSTLKGKLPYMAPEQLEGLEVDRQVDVYAAGVVLWELLVGRRLFVAENDAALACRVLAGPAQSPRELDGSIPATVDRACMRALARREARYRSALAFGDALEAAATESAVTIARPRSVAELARHAQAAIAPPSSSPISIGTPPAGDAATPDHDAQTSAPAPTEPPAPAPTAAPEGSPRETAAALPVSQATRITAETGAEASVPAARPVAVPLTAADPPAVGNAASAATPVLGSARAALSPAGTLRSEEGDARPFVIGAAHASEASTPSAPAGSAAATSEPAPSAPFGSGPYEHTSSAASLSSSIPGLPRRGRAPWAALGLAGLVAVAGVVGWWLLGAADSTSSPSASGSASAASPSFTVAPNGHAPASASPSASPTVGSSSAVSSAGASTAAVSPASAHGVGAVPPSTTRPALAAGAQAPASGTHAPPPTTAGPSPTAAPTAPASGGVFHPPSL